MPEAYMSLETRAGQSLGWLSRQLDRFAPLSRGRPDEFRLKAFTELALVYSYLQQWPQSTLSNAVRAWSGFIEEWCTTPVIAQMPRKRRSVALAYLLPYLMVRAIGFRCAYHEDTLARLARANDLRPIELVPYRALEREHVLWRSGVICHEPAWRRLASSTLLLRPGSLVGVDDEGAYAIAHALFYLTDFGNRPAPLSLRQRRSTVDLVEALVLHYWRIGNWDLVGELLTNLNCLDSCGSVVYAGASHAYDEAWSADGAVPPKRLAHGQSPATPASDDASFRVHYHPTLVAVLYCATAMNTRSAVPSREGTCTT